MNKTIAGLVCAIVMLVAIITAVVVSRPNESEEQLQIETNIADENICDLNYYIKNLIVKSNSIEEHSVYIEAQIVIDCFAYETKEIDVIKEKKMIAEKRALCVFCGPLKRCV